MKALVCEMCNSSDLVKQDGFFVCQHCGMKYTLEEAKKMMVEGTVKVDNSDAVQKYLVNARRAKQKEDWEETEKYYNLVEQNDPSNIEAIFYSAYGKARASLCVNEIYKREAVFNALKNSVSILDDNFDVEKLEETQTVLEQITTDVLGIFGSEFVFTQTKHVNNGITSYTDDADKTRRLFLIVAIEMYSTLEQIFAKIPDTEKEYKVFVGMQQLRLVDFVGLRYGHSALTAKEAWLKWGVATVERIKKVLPAYNGKTYVTELEQVQKTIKKQATKTKMGNIFGMILGAAIIGGAIYLIYLMFRSI